jgi:hypothetical protein
MMADTMRRWLGNSLGILLAVASVIGVYNVISDNGEVERLAQEAACGGGPGKAAQVGCAARKTMMERTPIAQTFEFATTKRQVTVRCARSALLVGDYSCEVK